jgi:hypothetical protein
MTAVP